MFSVCFSVHRGGDTLTAPAAFVDARESRQTVRECVCIGECDRIVVNVSLDNSGLGWLMLCQE